MSLFFIEALKDLKQTGSLTPSSKYLANKMIKGTDFTQPLKILELGAGEGVFTRKILQTMNEASSLYSFEINLSLFKQIDNIIDHRLHPIYGSVTDISSYLPDESIDLIISGIPLANLKNYEKTQLLKTSNRILKNSGKFVQFQYSLNDYKLIKEIFDKVELDFTLFNFPPAFIYHASKKEI